MAGDMANSGLRIIFLTICLALAARSSRVAFSAHARGGAFHSAATREVTRPPSDVVTGKVAKGMERATAHAQQAFEHAMGTQTKVAAVMLESVQSHGQVSESQVVELNKAISRSRNAKDLQAQVKQHNELISEFIDAVDAFKSLQKNMKTLRDQMADQHRAETARNKAQLEQALKKMREAWDTLRRRHHDEQIEHIGKILDHFGRISASTDDIGSKDAELNGADNTQVHPHVDNGTVAVRDWTNEEMADICLEYVESDDPLVKSVIVNLKAGLQKHGLILEEDSMCRAIIDALLQRFNQAGGSEAARGAMWTKVKNSISAVNALREAGSSDVRSTAGSGKVGDRATNG